jgi:predicted nucleic acid-binding protein
LSDETIISNVFWESSVIVRIVVGQPRPLDNWRNIMLPVASALVEIEVPRAIDALRRAGKLTNGEAARAAAEGRELVRASNLIEIDAAVRLRAAGPFSVPLRSLDAIHVATALIYRERNPELALTFATHDERVARAAQAHGLTVIGWPET